MRLRPWLWGVLAGLLVLAACARPAAVEEAPVTVTIGTQPWIGYGPWWIAKERGMDRAHGIDLRLVNFTTDQDLNSALAAGRMDGANMATHTSLILLSNDLPITVVLIEDTSTTADAVIAGVGVDSIADLAGKQVAFEEGATSDILLRHALEEAGMGIEDIRVVPMPAADAGAAAIAGRVEAAVTYEPYLSAALAEDPSFKIIYSGQDAPGLISDVLAFPDAFLEQHADVAEELLRVWEEALGFLEANPEEGRGIIARAVEADPAELASAFDGVQFFHLADSASDLAPGGAFRESMASILDVLVGQGAVEASFPFDQAVTERFAAAAGP